MAFFVFYGGVLWIVTAIGAAMLESYIAATFESINVVSPRAQGRQKRVTKTSASANPSSDLLGNYLGELGAVGLFSAEDEITQAKQLETLEIAAWTHILSQPHGADICYRCTQGLDEEVILLLTRLALTTVRPQHKRNNHVTMGGKDHEQIALQLRALDPDRDLFERVCRRLQRNFAKETFANTAIFGCAPDKAWIETLRDIRHKIAAVRNLFVRANLRLVVSIAKRFSNRRVPMMDLIQEGNMGLLKAVNRFDYHRGFRFSTYAHWWIRQSVERSIYNKETQIRIPMHVLEARRKLKRAETRLLQELERPAEITELAKETELSSQRIEQLRNVPFQDCLSLNYGASNGNGDPLTPLLDRVCDDTVISTETKLIKQERSQHLAALLKQLSPLENEIISQRFGIGNDKDSTLEEIGELHSLSRERVRQLQVNCLEKLRRWLQQQDQIST